MTATVNRTDLIRALTAFKRLALADGKKPNIFARSVGVSSDQEGLLLCTSQSLDARLVLRIPAQEAGQFDGCVDYQDALAALRYMPPDIRLENRESGHLALACEYGAITLPNDGREHVNHEPMPEHTPGKIEAEAMAGVLKEVRPFCGDYDALACLRLARAPRGHITAEAMNGHQYASSSANAPQVRAILPSKGLLIKAETSRFLAETLASGLLGDNLSLSVSWKEHTEAKKQRVPERLRLQGDQGALDIPLRNYDYPNTRGFRDKAKQSADCFFVEAGLFSRILRVMDPLVPRHNRSVLMNMSEQSMELTAGGGDYPDMRLRLDGRRTGELSCIAMPLRQLLAIVAGFPPASMLRMAFCGAEGPCLITAKGNPREIIIMPMKTVDTCPDWRESA